MYQRKSMTRRVLAMLGVLCCLPSLAQAGPSAPAQYLNLPLNVPLTVRALTVLEADVLEVEYKGQSIGFRFLAVAGAQKAEVEQVVGHQQLRVVIRAVEQDGTPFGDAWLLPKGIHLRIAVMGAMGQREALKEQRHAVVTERLPATKQPKKKIPPAPEARPALPNTETPAASPIPSRQAQAVESPQATASHQWQRLCQSLGETSYQVIAARERGVSLSQLMELAESHFQAHPVQIRQIQKGLIIAAYERRELSPFGAREYVAAACLKAFPK